MSGEQTLREHLEAIRDLADAEPPRTHDIYRRANEALRIIEVAETHARRYPPWFNEREQAARARRYRSQGASLESIAWMMDLPENELTRLLGVGAS